MNDICNQDLKSNNVFLAFLDILGFSDFIKNNDHSYAIHHYKNFFNLQIQLASALPEQIKREQPVFFRDKSKSYDEVSLNNVCIKSITMSDSVVFWTENNSLQDFYQLLLVIQQIMRLTFVFGFPLRGAISCGELAFSGGQLNNSSAMIQYELIGKPLVEAAELEKDQLWSGCVIHPNVVLQNIHVKNHINFFTKIGLITEYHIPKKDNSMNNNMSAVKWIHQQDEIDLSLISNQFSKYNKPIVNEKTKVIIENTTKFIYDMLNENGLVAQDIENAPADILLIDRLISKIIINKIKTPHIHYPHIKTK